MKNPIQKMKSASINNNRNRLTSEQRKEQKEFRNNRKASRGRSWNAAE